MKTLILTIAAFLLILNSYSQSSYGIYAGAQYCISHQKIIHTLPNIIFIDNKPHIGYLAGFRYAFKINDYFSVVNQTGYSQLNLLTPTENYVVSAHYLKSVFLVGITPFANCQGFYNNISLESGVGFARFLNGSKYLSAHRESKTEISYDIGLHIPVRNISVKPFMNIALTNYTHFDYPWSKIDFSFRTYGLLLIYQFKN
jgi:hypothetical protein